VCSSDLKSFLDNVFGVFPNPCVAQRQREEPSLVTLDEGFKCQFIASFGGSDKRLFRYSIAERSSVRDWLVDFVHKTGWHVVSPLSA
jgi:hypothetical protein